ncbi:hypothetical protein Ct61P_15498 [Colletotrichum tofieldiae]|nr:hypothetical protein Ct61P_15498 [Colletotrichum tofieldiae]
MRLSSIERPWPANFYQCFKAHFNNITDTITPTPFKSCRFHAPSWKQSAQTMRYWTSSAQGRILAKTHYPTPGSSLDC